MANDADAIQFLEAARNRLRASELLLANELYLDSMYIGGYVVECSLKALILSKSAELNSKEVDKLVKKLGHLVDHLMEAALEFDSVEQPSLEIEEAISILRDWVVDWRYEQKLAKHGSVEANAFVDAAKRILAWIEGSM